MSRREDDFTSTVEGAAGFEWWRSEEDQADRDYERREAMRDEAGGHHAKCRARDYSECFCEPPDEEDDDEHPDWCPLPPGHAPWAVVPVSGERLAVQECEPEPSDA